MTVKYQIDINNITKTLNGLFRTFEDKDGMLFIPAIADNTDYQQFKKDIQNGVVLNNAEGNPITGDALTTFLATLP